MSPAPTIDHLLPYSGRLLRRSADFDVPDEYGDPTWVETGEDVACWLEPMGSREELGLDPAVQLATHRLFLPPTTPPRGWDAIEVGGVRYELQGDGFARVRPQDGISHHVEAYVQAVE